MKCDVNIEYLVNHLIVIMVGENKWKIAGYYKQIYKFTKAAGLQYGAGELIQKWEGSFRTYTNKIPKAKIRKMFYLNCTLFQ